MVYFAVLLVFLFRLRVFSLFSDSVALVFGDVMRLIFGFRFISLSLGLLLYPVMRLHGSSVA